MRSIRLRLTGVALFCFTGVLTAAERPAQPPPLVPGTVVQRGSPIPASQRPTMDLESFGIQDQDGDVVSAYDFMPFSSTGQSYDSGFGLRWGESPQGTGSYHLRASMNMLPNGAYVPLISVYYFDVDPAEDLFVYICQIYRDFGSVGENCFVSFQSQGAPGFTHDFIVVPDAYKTFLRRRDADGDGDLDLIDYSVMVTGGSQTGSVAIGAVRPLWFRKVSPAPAAASFNDVPASDPYFQYIEALVASGVTAGCGGGNYCPDAPLTRWQMAVFLAKALGLHWPF